MTWTDTPDQSSRWTNRFAYLPVQTFDAGWIWLRRYWLYEKIWGWGFHDRFPYLEQLEQSEPETGNPEQGCTHSEQLFRENQNIRSEAQFLIDRLGEFEADNLSDETARDWYGHVVPSIETLRILLARAAT